MTGDRRFEQARSISFDFDGVLSSLVLGRRWAKTRKKKRPATWITPPLRALRIGVESLTEGFRKPYPNAAAALRRLRASGRTLAVLSSRADERIALAERWLDRRALRALFERLYFNADADDADAFKEAILRANPIDVHIDDDPGTVAHLAPLFPDKLFVHLDHRRRGGAAGANVVVVHDWDGIASLLTAESPF
jgi:hypothetical protein